MCLVDIMNIHQRYVNQVCSFIHTLSHYQYTHMHARTCVRAHTHIHTQHAMPEALARKRITTSLTLEDHGCKQLA